MHDFFLEQVVPQVFARERIQFKPNSLVYELIIGLNERGCVGEMNIDLLRLVMIIEIENYLCAVNDELVL